LGKAWTALVEQWYAREKATNFVKAAGFKSSKQNPRPKQVSEWVNSGRRASFKPRISNASAFGQVVVQWWYDVNPEWRRQSKWTLLKQAGDYRSLEVPGPNGFLNILICLKWWADASPGRAGAKWDAAVDEIAWTLHQMER
ncbi:hypothetical protein C8F01DRAFT_943388, partial [Mycena amicta]